MAKIGGARIRLWTLVHHRYREHRFVHSTNTTQHLCAELCKYLHQNQPAIPLNFIHNKPINGVTSLSSLTQRNRITLIRPLTDVYLPSLSCKVYWSWDASVLPPWSPCCVWCLSFVFTWKGVLALVWVTMCGSKSKYCVDLVFMKSEKGANQGVSIAPSRGFLHEYIQTMCANMNYDVCLNYTQYDINCILHNY